MQNVFKQFGARDIGSFNQRFRWSIWRLTSFYVVILAAILIVSSSIIYGAFSNRLEHRFREIRPIPNGIIISIPPQPSPDDVRADLIYSLVLVNGILLLAAGFASYWLAKTTLLPIEDSYERQRKFLADASHELRTPLAIMHTDLENQLLANAGDAKAASNLEEVARMTNLVTDLLTLSRLDENMPQEPTTTFNLQEVVQNTAMRLEPLARQHNAHLTVEASEKILIHSQLNMIPHALSNVIKNAIIYNKPDGLVTVKLSKSKNAAVITVTDTGIGISENDLSRVFDRFYRSDTSRSRQTGGSGLGLSIVQSSIASIGGSVNVESRIDSGTTFTIQIPLK